MVLILGRYFGIKSLRLTFLQAIDIGLKAGSFRSRAGFESPSHVGNYIQVNIHTVRDPSSVIDGVQTRALIE